MEVWNATSLPRNSLLSLLRAADCRLSGPAVTTDGDPLLPQSAVIHTTRHNGTVPIPSQFPDQSQEGPLLPFGAECRMAAWLYGCPCGWIVGG